MNPINTVIFDLGNVLINWDPNRLYEKIFNDAEERIHFLTNICTPHWNEQQDAGRTWAEATELLINEHPYYENEIKAYYDRWAEMIGGPIHGSVDILKQLKAENKVRLYALTNWSTETFPYALENFDFLQLFEGILVSGEEKLVKPDPAIYQLLLDRYQIVPEKSIFIDDSLRNVETAAKIGIHALHFTSSDKLRTELGIYGLLK